MDPFVLLLVVAGIAIVLRVSGAGSQGPSSTPRSSSSDDSSSLLGFSSSSSPADDIHTHLNPICIDPTHHGSAMHHDSFGAGAGFEPSSFDSSSCGSTSDFGSTGSSGCDSGSSGGSSGSDSSF